MPGGKLPLTVRDWCLVRYPTPLGGQSGSMARERWQAFYIVSIASTAAGKKAVAKKRSFYYNRKKSPGGEKYGSAQ